MPLITNEGNLMATTIAALRHPLRAAAILAATIVTCSPLIAVPMAIAEPDSNGWDADNFKACLAQIPAGDNDYTYHYFLCCQQSGGTPTDRPDLKGCAIPTGNGVMGQEHQLDTTDPAPPPPGATVILPPGVNTRAGIQ
jgi:hypothetical protein